jgi:hypothetical protein
VDQRAATGKDQREHPARQDDVAEADQGSSVSFSPMGERQRRS